MQPTTLAFAASDPAALTTLVTRYLGSIYEDPDFTAFYRLHSGSAHLLLGTRVVQARELSAPAYAHAVQALLSAHALDPAALRRRTPRFTLSGVLGVHPGPAHPGDEALVLVALREADGAPRTAAFGLALDAQVPAAPRDPGLRVRWATLCGDPTETAAERLQAQAHGELAYLPLGGDGQPLLLTALELSHHRQHRLPQAPLSFLPEAAFSCHMSARCCDNDWQIHLSAADRAALEARDFRRRLPQLPAGRPLYTRIPADQEGGDPRPFAMARREPLRDPGTSREGDGTDRRCVLLDDERRCVAHGEAGMAIYSDCHLYPFGFTFTPDGVAAWAMLYCPSARARKGRPFADNQPDIRGRLQRIPHGAPPTRFALRQDVSVPWQSFRASEEILLRYLAAPVPLRQRLLAALRWLERAADGPALAALRYDESLLHTPLLPPVDAERDLAGAVFTMMTQNPYLRPLPPPARPAPAPARFLDEALGEADFLPYLLRTLVFSKALSFRYGIVPGFNYAVLAYALFVRRYAGHRLEDLSEDALGVYFTSLQQAHYHRLLAAVQEHALLRELANSPLFGELLLRAAVCADPAR